MRGWADTIRGRIAKGTADVAWAAPVSSILSHSLYSVLPSAVPLAVERLPVFAAQLVSSSGYA